jgi:hypothetical protein
MKTFVIAQHHGVFLTLKSMHDCGIDDIVVIVPGGQVEKYNKMYSEKPEDPEYQAFQNYDKRIKEFIQNNNIQAEVFVYDGFDIRNTVSSALRFVDAYGCREIVACLLSGTIVIKDYRDNIKEQLLMKEIGACSSRVYQNHNQLSMYHMIGLPQIDKSLDVNFFAADMTKIRPAQLEMDDSNLLNDATKRKQLAHMSREFNGKDDPLIGTAISARQTIAHNLRIQAGFIVNLWNKSIKGSGQLKSEELFGYPFNYYSKYVREVGSYLPKSTVNKIINNGEETEKWTGGLYDCLDIIDL